METTPLLPRTRRKPFWSRLLPSRFKRRELTDRTIDIGLLPTEKFPPNYVCNQKYSIITFLPLVLFEQFRYFLNLFFLIMALSQFIPSIRIGYLYTYWGPLIFVISVTLFREAVDDIRRYRRDREVNRQYYERIVMDLTNGHQSFKTERVPASALRVGDIVMLQKGERVPADMILLRTNDTAGTVYIRTDQLDGETDWKLRMSLPSTQKLPSDEELLQIHAKIHVEKPQQDIHSFIGRCTRFDEEDRDPIDIQNTMWSGCVVASGHATGLVIYTGSETRAVMNNSAPRSKVGLLDLKLNDITKILFAAVLGLSFLLIVLKGFNGPWFGFMIRFLLLFSYIIPISLRVNLDVSKVFYSWTIQRDKKIEGTVMRSTNIPEELGRIQYVLADKTGTLTRNEMVFQKLHLEGARFNSSNFHEVESLLTQHATSEEQEDTPTSTSEVSPSTVWETVLALALCHNVTPVAKDRIDSMDDSASDMTGSVMSESGGGAVPQQQLCEYQASSPDEIALVHWTDMMGLSLYERDLHNISVKVRARNDIMAYTILQIFPFTSETKMMGIIVQEEESGSITYYVKGADVALARTISSEWMLSESRRLAAEGLRTLVYAKKTLTQQEYDAFEAKYREARCSKDRRNENTAYVVSKLNAGLKLLAVTGVEDKLARDVPETLDKLRKAGIKTWMLTGDKLETALCIARSLRLSETDSWHVAPSCGDRVCAHELLDAISDGRALIIEGDALETCLRSYSEEFISALCQCSAVVVARCSPTQKAAVAGRLRGRGRAVLAAGDGGNDVAMIQQADIGVGIEGAEGRAASLAGDVSTRSFSCLARLLLVHGRRCCKRSAALSLFIVHRGLIVSTMQAVFSVVFYFSSVSLYPGFLMVGYGTIYTMLPVFSLVLDKDLPSTTILKHPQLYKQLTGGRYLSYKTFCIWTAISIYQGAVIMYGALVLFEDQLIHIVEISYTALILTELIMVALSVVTWHRLMLLAEMSALAMYIATLIIFNSYFDSDFLQQWSFWWKVTVITLVSCLPLYIVKYTRKKWRYRQYRLLRNGV